MDSIPYALFLYLISRKMQKSNVTSFLRVALKKLARKLVRKKVKKWMAQGHELDKEHLAKELGDVAWYLAEAATALDISLEDIFKANIDKLKKRYPDGFETKKSLVRLKGDI